MPTTQVMSEGSSNIVYEPVCPLCDDGHVLLAKAHASPSATTTLGLHLEEGRWVVLKGARHPTNAESHASLEYELTRMLAVRGFNKENTAEPLDMAYEPNSKRPFLVEEYIGVDNQPETLDTWVAGRKAELGDTYALATDSVFLSVAAGIAKVLGDVHSAGCVYADLKGQNVMVAHGKPTLVDFGSCRKEGSPALPSSSGTLEYMSPEQFIGEITKQSDSYSLGVCLYEALTDRPPLRAAELRSEQGRLPLGFVDPIKYHVRELNPRVHPDLASMIHDCLSVVPEMRPSMKDIRATLLKQSQLYGGVSANTRTAA